MPILAAIAGSSSRIYGLLARIKKLITDNFTRANGSLGTSTTGDVWSTLKGTWSISSNNATSSDSASTYPLAVVDVQSQDMIVSADITNGGVGVAFWVTDANSWWASSVEYNLINTAAVYGVTCCTCNGPSTTAAGGSTSGAGCGTYTAAVPATPCSWSQIGSTTSSSFSILVDPCTNNNVTNVISSSTTYSCAGTGKSLCNTNQCCTVAPPSYSCSDCTAASSTTTYTIYTGTSYSPATAGTPASYSGSMGSYSYLISSAYDTYYTNLKIYNESGEVASQNINNNTSSYVKGNSIKVTTSGNTISAVAYQNSGLGSAFATTLTTTPSSPTKGTKAGLVKTPSLTNQGTQITNFSAENNI